MSGFLDQIRLRAAIARRMPNHFTVYNEENEFGVCWADTDKPISEREWFYVAYLAEKLIGVSGETADERIEKVLKKLNNN
jgi:hypothetical protein